MAFLAAVLASALLGAPSPAPAPAEELFDAARRGDRARVARLLDGGLDVNTKGRYDATALTFAADKGRLEVVRLLVERGADVNVQDTFYRSRPMQWALYNDHFDVVLYLLAKGSKGAGAVLSMGIGKKHGALVEAALASPELTTEDLAEGFAAGE
jgi:ankyrin repeat protein